MVRASIEMIIRGMNAAGVRYLVVGGLAVVAHGYVRLTADLDLVLDPEPSNLRRALTAFAALGYKPRAPVPLEQFADPEKRAEWARTKGLTVFSLHSAEHAATEIDLFLEPPFGFARAYAAAVSFEVAPGVAGTFVRLEDLVAMKRRAGRPQDLDDVKRLIELDGEMNHG
jgi:predicted nucleotidyltransferase